MKHSESEGAETTMGVESNVNPLSPAIVECPFGYFAQLRRQPPVYVHDGRFFLISRYEDVQHVLLHPEIFSSAGSPGVRRKLPPEVVKVMAAGFRPVPTVQTIDPPAHQRYRSLLSKAFSSRRVARLEPQIRQVANDLVDKFIDDGKVDLVSQFAVPFPLTVIATWLGLPVADLPSLKRWSDAAAAPLGGMLDRASEIECARIELEAQQYFAARLDERRREPRDDILSDLCRAHLNGSEPLDNGEIYYLLIQLLVAGNESVRNLISSAMLLLLQHPAHMAAVRAQPTLIPKFVEEALRIESPIKAFFRMAKSDTQVGGVKIPAGSRLAVLYASANRDENHFSEPDVFDIHRANASDHLAFGSGVHYCLGAPLARTEARIAFEVLLSRLSDIRLAPGNKLTHTESFIFRGLKALHLEFSACGSQPGRTECAVVSRERKRTPDGTI
jgi:cytochrome P450